MNNIDRQYKELLEHIIRFGVDKQDRTGTGTKSIFGWQIRHRMSEGFPLITTKKMAWKSIVVELLWFLRGDTNIKYLVDNGCHIWDGDCYKNYLSNVNNGRIYPNSFTKEEFINKIKTDDDFAKKWGELGPIYGKQWREWENLPYDDYDKQYKGYLKIDVDSIKEIDQIQNLINDLKTNPDSRRLMVNAWNVGELDSMVLPPCHYGFQVYTRELTHKERELIWVKTQEQCIVDDYKKGIGAKEELLNLRNIPTRAISLMWSQRSVDTFLGLPFNIASYALLLEIIAKEVNMLPEELIGNLGDTHLYSNHIEQAKEQINRIPYDLPVLGKLPDYLCGPKGSWECYKPGDIKIENYQSHPAIKAPLSN